MVNLKKIVKKLYYKYNNFKNKIKNELKID